MDFESKNNGLKFNQDLVSISRDLEEKDREITKSTESSRVLREMSRDVEGKSRELTKIHRATATRRDEKKLQCQKSYY